MLTSMGLMGRTEPLHIYAPASLEFIIEAQLKAADASLPYPVYFVSLENLSAAFTASGLRIQAFATDHRIPCWGFSFETQGKPRSIIKEKVDEYNIPISFYESLQNGFNYEDENGIIISNDLLTTAVKKKKYAYCADTRYCEDFLPHIIGVDLMYHEATFLKEENQKAYERFHSTSEQAATLAKKAGVKKLLLGHFSSRYIDLEPFKTEARQIFENTEIAEEGCCFIF
jgi:ribonuclease Z